LFLPASAAVPNPETHFGHKIGVDYELLDWDKAVSYFQSLAKSSDRIKFVGKTIERRAQIAGRFRCASHDPVHGELPNWPEYDVWQVAMGALGDL